MYLEAYLVMLLAAILIAVYFAHKAKHNFKKSFVGAFFAIFMGLLVFTAPAVGAVGSPKALGKSAFVVPHLSAIVQFYKEATTSAYQVAEAGIPSITVNLSIGMDGVMVKDLSGRLINTYSYDDLQLLSGKPVHVMDTEDLDSEINNKKKEAEYYDSWGVLGIAEDSLVYGDSNTTNTYVSTNKYIVLPSNASVNFNYTVILQGAESNSTGSTSAIYLVFANNTATQEISVVSGIWRNKIDVWGTWIYNSSEITLSGTVVLQKIKIVNFNYEHLNLYKVDALILDQRSVNMTINGVSFAQLAKRDASIKGYHITAWTNNFISYLHDTPTPITRTANVRTGAFGWESPHDVVDSVGKAILGDNYANAYNVNSYKLALNAGSDLQKTVGKVIEDAQDKSASAADTAAKVLNEDLHSVTVAVDANAKALQDNLDSAGKSVVDATHGVIAAISDSLGGTGQVVMDNINGFTKSVTETINGVQQTVTNFQDTLTGVFTGIYKGFMGALPWIALVAGILIAVVLILYLYFNSASGTTAPTQLLR